MTEIDRVIKVIDWLIFEKKVKSRRELAEVLGYAESSISQILNKKVPLSDRFIKKLLSISKDINEDWVMNENGMMLKNINQTNVNGDNINGHSVTVHKSETDRFLEIIKNSQGQLDKSQEQIDRLLGIIEKLSK